MLRDRASGQPGERVDAGATIEAGGGVVPGALADLRCGDVETFDLVGVQNVSALVNVATDARIIPTRRSTGNGRTQRAFGLRLTRRALVDAGGRKVPAVGLWSLVFLLVVLQMSTTLRPLVGPFEGLGLAEKEFFLSHWIS